MECLQEHAGAASHLGVAGGQGPAQVGLGGLAQLRQALGGRLALGEAITAELPYQPLDRRIILGPRRQGAQANEKP